MDSKPHSPSTLVAMLQESVSLFSSKTALYFFGAKIKYWKLGMLVERFATGLQKLGVKKGDRVAICLPNCPQAVIAYFAILQAGGIVVPCNPMYKEYELLRQIKNAEANIVVIFDAMYEKVQNADMKTIIVVQVTKCLPLLKQLYLRFTKPKPAVIQRTDSTLFFEDVLTLCIPLLRTHFPRVSPKDTALLQYTGGTTGVSKGAELTHENLSTNIMQLQIWFKNIELGKEKFLVALPLFHVFAMTGMQNLCLSVGGTMILIPDPSKLAHVKEGLRWGTTITALVPKFYSALLGECTGKDFATVKYCISGGAGLPKTVSENFSERTGKKIIEGYGLTETSPVTHCNLPENPKEGSIGLLMPLTEGKIVDDGGTELPIENDGELWVRGPQVMKGYWRNPEETALVLMTDGWLKTGDAARRDNEGFFYIVDRKKDMILSNTGLNVYPREIEETILMHPAVDDAAAIGVPMESGGETIKVFVVLKKGLEVSSSEVIEHCKERLAPYKIPRKVEFRSVLPKSIIGKTLRRILREEETKKRNPIQP